jgi:hypothetical protein
VFSKRAGKKIRRTFAREAAAKSWRADAVTALSKGDAAGTEADHRSASVGCLVRGR